MVSAQARVNLCKSASGTVSNRSKKMPDQRRCSSQQKAMADFAASNVSGVITDAAASSSLDLSVLSVSIIRCQSSEFE